MKSAPAKLPSGSSWLRLLLATLALAAAGAAQQPPAPAPPPPRADARAAQLPAAVLRVTTRLVLVDVVVADAEGRPVTDLTRDAFVVLEDGEPQTISVFTLESPDGRRSAGPAPPLPPNVYTNRPDYEALPGPLTILLLDALNTPVTDQAFARQKMLDYLRSQLLQDQRTAILALTNNLLVLQDFTSDPEGLQAALNQFQPETSTALIRERREGELTVGVVASGGGVRPIPQKVIDNLERFQTEQTAVSLDSRVLTTLEALRAIARAVGGYPGRKNLIWVSAAFPFALVPEESVSYDLVRYYSQDIHRTASALSDAQIAVYPVDARGLVGAMGARLPSAAESGRAELDRLPAPPEVVEDVDRRTSALLYTQHTARHIASATGGRAFDNRNDIDQAIALSVQDGSTYYALGYHPKDTAWDGKFRRIRVQLKRPGLQVRHRRGYYAYNPVEASVQPGQNLFSGGYDARDHSQALRAALSNPLPATTVTFLVGVPQPPPPAAGAPARVECRFLVDTETLLGEESAEGRHYDLDFLVVAYDNDGQGVASRYHTVETQIPLEKLAWVRENGLPYTLDLELPPGSYHLRLVVHDNRTGLVGTADASVLIDEPKT